MKNAGLSSILIAMTLLTVVVIAEAQQPKKVFRIGYLSPVDAATDSPRAEGIRLALRELGYIDGQNIAIEYRYAEGKNDRLPELAAELARLKVDIIVVSGGDRPIRAAKNATKTIPIVMMGQGTDPVRAGHVKSLARPGGTSYSNVGFKAPRFRGGDARRCSRRTENTAAARFGHPK